MTQFDDYWARLERANPALANDANKMNISVAALRKLLRKCHTDGWKSGLATAKSLENLGGSQEAPDGAFAKALDTIKNMLNPKK